MNLSLLTYYVRTYEKRVHENVEGGGGVHGNAHVRI